MGKSVKIVVLVVVLAIMFIVVSKYNNLVVAQENVSESYAQIESNLQRQVDLLPNLVKLVKAYAKHESELLKEITKLRATADTLPTDIEDMQKLNKNMNLATMRFFAVAENYPNLKSSEQFLQLQSQIEGSQNRINITRMQYNMNVKNFNAEVRTFPSNLIANLTGFSSQEYFKAKAKAHKNLELDL